MNVASPEPADPEHPVFFVVRQQKQVMSWQLPMIDKIGKQKYVSIGWRNVGRMCFEFLGRFCNNCRITYHVANRTLCSNTFGDGSEDEEQTIFVTVSSSSATNVKYSIFLTVEPNFMMK